MDRLITFGSTTCCCDCSSVGVGLDLVQIMCCWGMPGMPVCCASCTCRQPGVSVTELLTRCLDHFGRSLGPPGCPPNCTVAQPVSFDCVLRTLASELVLDDFTGPGNLVLLLSFCMHLAAPGGGAPRCHLFASLSLVAAVLTGVGSRSAAALTDEAAFSPRPAAPGADLTQAKGVAGRRGMSTKVEHAE